MATTTRVPQILAYLVAAFTASPALGAATPPVLVYDGPKVTGDTGTLALWVGVDDIDTATPISADSQQEWMPGAGRAGRTEQISVHCTLQAKSGSDDVPSLRAQVADALSAVEGVLRADPSLGGATPGVKNAGVTSAEWRQYPLPPGMAVRVMFTISASAIIGTP
jgi:hypothetical protein